ncbi:MAG: RdgB/HAM1 family non-canonical purine NTP pyrophosphatase [Thermoplasmata archaeon]
MLIKVITTNSGKFREISHFFINTKLKFKMEPVPLLEIQANTLEEVVAEKLASVPEETGNCIVDDSGLFVDALSGFPGVYSSYVYRTIGVHGLCKLLEGMSERKARFECVVGLRISGKKHFFKGVCEGRIIEVPKGSGGFGFDPIFMPDGYQETFAQLPTENKNLISHRGRALQQLREFFQTQGIL